MDRCHGHTKHLHHGRSHRGCSQLDHVFDYPVRAAVAGTQCSEVLEICRASKSKRIGPLEMKNINHNCELFCSQLCICPLFQVERLKMFDNCMLTESRSGGAREEEGSLGSHRQPPTLTNYSVLDTRYSLTACKSKR
jgi:hypothetical protein